jgi:hypothetical protein
MVSYVEFLDTLEAATHYVDQLRPLRENQASLDAAEDIIIEMKFVASYNHKFRDNVYESLNQLLDEMYVEIYSDEVEEARQANRRTTKKARQRQESRKVLPGSVSAK